MTAAQRIAIKQQERNRARALAQLSVLLGRRIGSRNEITPEEVPAVLGWLDNPLPMADHMRQVSTMSLVQLLGELVTTDFDKALVTEVAIRLLETE